MGTRLLSPTSRLCHGRAAWGSPRSGSKANPRGAHTAHLWKEKRGHETSQAWGTGRKGAPQAPPEGLEEAHSQCTPPCSRLGHGSDTEGLTWRLKSLCSSPFLGGAGGWPFQSRSGGTDPSSPKTFSSWKHSVSTIYPRTAAVRVAPGYPAWRPPHSQGSPYLILPGDGHTTRGELVVEVLVRGLQIHALYRRELFNVQNVLAVNSLGLGVDR